MTEIGRRGFLKIAAGAVAAAGLGWLVNETLKPNVFEEQAKKLWDEYQKDPQAFINANPSGVYADTIAGPNGIRLRSVPFGEMKESIIRELPPNTKLGTAITYPSEKSADGVYLTQERDGKMVFFAKREVIDRAKESQNQP